MNGTQKAKHRLVAAGTALMVVVGLLAAFGGTASAAPVAPAGAPTAEWAYGGMNNSSGSWTVGNLTVTWSTSIGVAVIFNATPTATNVTELQAHRTIGVNIQVGLAVPNASLTFAYKATEVDAGYANVTNASQVDSMGTMVPALGILDSSFHGTANLAESVVLKATHSASAFLNVSAVADAAVQFSPALGVVPLNLTANPSWNSTATATPSADWNVSYDYAVHGWNGTSATGSHSVAGSWTASGPVYLYGEVLTHALPPFHDHATRSAIVLSVHGPMSLYDGFIVIPRGFDVFGGAHQAYDSYAVSNYTVSSDTLYLSHGHLRATSFTASKVRIGGAAPTLALAGATHPTATPTGTNGGNVTAQPEGLSAAQAQSKCMTKGCPLSGPWFSGLVAAAVIGGLIAAVAGTVGVVEWRSYSRRKNRTNQLVGGYGEGMALGVPPAVIQPTAPPTSGPTGGPAQIDGPTRPL